MRKSDYTAIFEAYNINSLFNENINPANASAAATNAASKELFNKATKAQHSSFNIVEPEYSQKYFDDDDLSELIAWQEQNPELAKEFDEVSDSLDHTDDLARWGYQQLIFHINMAFHDRSPLLIYGDSGLGKSEIVDGICKRIAQQQGLEFIDLDKLRAKDLEMLVNAEDISNYFIFLNKRMDGINPEDIKGLPATLTTQDTYLKYKKDAWAYIFANPTAQGTLFVDELNHAAEETTKSLFTLFDKTPKLDDLVFSDNVNIIAAGNLDPAHGNKPLTPGAISRFKQGILIVDPEGWFKWADAAGIEKTIIEYVRFSPEENFYIRPVGGESNPFPNPRSFEKLSVSILKLKANFRVLKNTQGANGAKFNLIQQMYRAAEAYCGRKWAQGYLAFVRSMETFCLKELHSRGHELVNGYLQSETKAIDKLYHLVHFVINKFREIGKTVQTRQGPVQITVDLLLGIMFRISIGLYEQNNDILKTFWERFKLQLYSSDPESSLTNNYVTIINRMGELINKAKQNPGAVCSATGLTSQELTDFVKGPFTLVKSILSAKGEI